MTQHGHADALITQGSCRASTGPRRFATASGSLLQTAVAILKTGRSGDGGLALPERDHVGHGSGMSWPPHCNLNLCVAPPGVHLPKLKARAPRRIDSSMSDA